MTISIDINGKNVDAQQLRGDWALALMSKGVIVRLSISRWRATAPLKSEELGLRFSDNESSRFMKRYVSLGTEKLLPPEITKEFSFIEQRARNNLDAHSFNTLWGKFIPYTAFNSWEEKHKIIHDDFFEAAKKFGERYPEIVKLVKAEYCAMAKDVWVRTNPNKGEAPQSFVEDFSSKIIEKIPSCQTILSTFKLETTFFIIPLPSMIAEEVAKVNDIEREQGLKSHEAQLEKETKEKIAQTYLSKKHELVDAFLEATVLSMRGYIADLCDSVLLSLSNNDKKDIDRQQIKKIKEMISKVKLLNFYDDKEIRLLLNDLEIEVDRFKGQRDKNTIIQRLQDIISIGEEEYFPSNFNPAISSLEI